jgi:OmpA-OmpF porin, OOP family
MKNPSAPALKLSAFIATLCLAACAHNADQAKMAAKPLSNASTQTDRSIHTDLRGYEAQQTVIKALNDSGKHPVKSYSLAKAQCWLDVSLHEYSRNDRSRWPQLALQESVKITSYLEQGGTLADASNPANQTPLVNNATKLREDLWAAAEGLKKQSGFKCAEKLVACAEVELVHAGNEHSQQGWRHAKPYVQIAEDQLSEAQAALKTCEPPAASIPTAPTPVLVPAARSVEKVTLNASALFRFNKRRQSDLLPEGKAELDDLANKINSVYASVEHIELVGFTDRLGSERYNDKLSLDRANTVKAYLESRGIKAQITTAGRGKASPVVTSCGVSNKPTKRLTSCLQPNRRVEVTIVGIKR